MLNQTEKALRFTKFRPIKGNNCNLRAHCRGGIRDPLNRHQTPTSEIKIGLENKLIEWRAYQYAVAGTGAIIGIDVVAIAVTLGGRCERA